LSSPGNKIRKEEMHVTEISTTSIVLTDNGCLFLITTKPMDSASKVVGHYVNQEGQLIAITRGSTRAAEIKDAVKKHFGNLFN